MVKKELPARGSSSRPGVFYLFWFYWFFQKISEKSQIFQPACKGSFWVFGGFGKIVEPQRPIFGLKKGQKSVGALAWHAQDLGGRGQKCSSCVPRRAILETWGLGGVLWEKCPKTRYVGVNFWAKHDQNFLVNPGVSRLTPTYRVFQSAIFGQRLGKPDMWVQSQRHLGQIAFLGVFEPKIPHVVCGHRFPTGWCKVGSPNARAGVELRGPKSGPEPKPPKNTT